LRTQPGPPLGTGDGNYPVAKFELPIRGTLAFFTDGLIDQGRANAERRFDALSSMMEDHRDKNSESLADSIVRTLGPAKPGSDDLAVLIIQWSRDTAA
jgi:serine phosphatase RsbU (regulator of sigma subunit)